MKNTIRRLAGWLMALMMVFGSVIVPTGSGDRYALAEGDDGIANQLLQAGTEGEGEGEITEPNYVNLKRLYDLYYEALTMAEGLSEEELLPEIVLGEEWAALMPEDQALLRLLISGAWDFVYDDLGALIGVQEHVFEIDIPADAAEQTTPPPAQEDPDPAGEIPEVTFVDGDLVTNPPAANDDAEGGDLVTNPPAANDDAEGGDLVTNPPAANDDAEGGDQVTNPPAANDDAEGGDQVTNPPAVEGGDQVTNPPAVEDAGEEETIPGAAEPTAEGSETYPVAEEGTETLEVEEASEGSGTLDVVDEVIEEIVEPADSEQELIPENKEEEEVTGGEEIPGGEAAFVGGRMNADEEFAEETRATGLNATRFTVKNAQMLKISQDAGEGNEDGIQEINDTADGKDSEQTGKEALVLHGTGETDNEESQQDITGTYYVVHVEPSASVIYNARSQTFRVSLKSRDTSAPVNITQVKDTSAGVVVTGVPGSSITLTIDQPSSDSTSGPGAQVGNYTVTLIGSGTQEEKLTLRVNPAVFTEVNPSSDETADWTGDKIQPKGIFTVKAGNLEIPPNDFDFEANDGDAVSVGTYTYTVKAIPRYNTAYNITIPDNTSVTLRVKYNLSSDITPTTITPATAPYTGAEIKPTVNKVEIKQAQPTVGVLPIEIGPENYTVTYNGTITDPGKYEVTVTGKNNAYNSKTATFTVNASLTYELSGTTTIYNKSAQEPTAIFKANDIPVTLAEGSYTLKYKAPDGTYAPGSSTFPVNAAIYDVKLELSEDAKEVYTLTDTDSEKPSGFTITPATLTYAVVGSKTYNRGTQTAELTFKSGDTTVALTADDYTLSYVGIEGYPLNAGNYTPTVTLTNPNCVISDEQTAQTFVINQAVISTANLDPATKQADGTTDWKDHIVIGSTNTANVIKLIATTSGSSPLELRADEIRLSASSPSMIQVGDYTVIYEITDTTNFEAASADVLQVPFTVTAKPITAEWKSNPANSDKVTYNQKNQRTTLEASLAVLDGTATIDASKYTVTVKQGDTEVDEVIEADTYNVTVTGNTGTPYASYTYSIATPFEVVPAVVDSWSLDCDTATYDRTDWSDNFYLNGADTSTATYPIVISAKAVGAEGTQNKATIDASPLTLTSSDGLAGLVTNEMINAGKYTDKITVTVSNNYSVGGTPAGTFKVPFTIVPAEVDEIALAYDNATYNRKDWAENLYLYGGEETGDYPNVITGTAIGVAGTVNADMEPLVLSLPVDEETVDGFVSFKPGEIIDAGEYKEIIAVKVSSNYVTEGTEPDTYTLGFTVNPAEIDSAALDYNKTFYDRHDWHGELLTFDKKKDKPADYDNVLTIKTKPVKYGEKVSDEVLTLNEKTEDMAAAADEYEIKTGTIKNAGSYSVEWSLTDTVDFVVEEARKDELQKLPFTVEKAEITSVTIKRDDGDADTSATVVYDGAEWRDRIGINDAKGEHHFFIVKATTASKTIPGTDFVIGSLTLTNSEYELSYPKRDPNGKIIRIGEYTVQEDLTDTTNFKYSATLDLEGEKTGAKPYVQLPFTVTRYEVEPIRDTTASVVGPSKDSVVKYKSVYHMGPEQSESARILTFTGEPGEEVNVTIGGTTVRTTFSGTKYTNYGGGSTTGTLKLTISSSGVVTIDRTSTTVKLTPNSDTTITLSYADAANLKDGSAEKDPGTLSVKVHFDTIKPQIATAVDPFLNRDMTVSITVPEAGRLDSISFDETISVEDVDYVSESENYGKFKATLDVPWNTEGAPHLIHSGKEAIEMKYTDLVYNTASAKFDIGQSTGAPIIITIEPIVSADKERIDMDERPEQVKVTVEGTGYELMYLTFEPSKSDQASGTATGTGAWVRESTGEWSTIVETDAFSNDYDITATSWYDDLVGQEVYTFFFDDVADPIILTVPEITEDNWVIPGIAEANSEVRITVDGEKVLTKNDRFTIFTGRKPQLKAGSQVRIVATDLSNNRAEVNLTVQPSPTDGMQTLDAYAMGKVYTDAHTTKEEPKWLMAGLYTEEELTKGVSVPLIAGSAFHIGEVQLKMEGGKLNTVFTPKEGVTLSGQKVTAQIATSRVFNMESFNAGEKKNAENAIGYWISAYVQAKIPVEMLHQTFQLDENQAEIRSFYFNRQRLESMPE